MLNFTCIHCNHSLKNIGCDHIVISILLKILPGRYTVREKIKKIERKHQERRRRTVAGNSEKVGIRKKKEGKH